MARRTAYLNARLIDPASGLDVAGQLLTEGDTILDLGPDLFAGAEPEDAEVVHCGGRVVAPGLIDSRVFVGEPGGEHRETLASASRAAVAGGVASIVVMPNTSPVIDDPALVEYLARRGREAGCARVYPMAAVTKGLDGQRMTEMGLLASAGAVAFTEGDRAVASALVMRRALSYASTFGVPIVQFPQDADLARDGVMNGGEVAMRLGLLGIPTQAETIVVERDIRLLELSGGRLHVATVSTADAIDAVRRAKRRGLPITAAAAVHSFALNETEVGEYRTFAKTAPPLRDEPDRLAVADGIADGTIDVICSGHDPQDVDSKRLPFEQAAFGIIGLETLLPLSLELYHNGRLGLADLLAKLTCAPARLLGLPGGRLAPGAPADLVIFDPDRPWRIDETRFRSRSKNSPFHGRPVQGQVWRTVVAGEMLHELRAEG